MKALFTSFHMMYCLSQCAKYSLRYGGIRFDTWERPVAFSPRFGTSETLRKRNGMKALFTSFHMYCLSQYSKYSLKTMDDYSV